MYNRVACAAVCAAFLIPSAFSQTSVTTTSGGAAGSIPVFTSGTNVENSAITQSGSNVGIGTTSPQAPLDIRSGGLISAGVMDLNGSSVNSGNTSLILNNGSTGGESYTLTAGIPNITEGGFSINKLTNYSFGAWMQTYLSTTVLAIRGGNVGIGTTTPAATLEVNGTTRVDGDLTVNGTGGVSVAGGGITFPDGTVQTTAYPAASSGGSAPLQFVTNANENNENEAEVEGGISANGSGMKHVSSNASCQTYQYNWNYCSVTINWPGTPFSDTNYDVVCTPKTGAAGNNSNTPQGMILYVPDSGKTTTSATVTIQVSSTTNAGGLITLAPGFSCIAIHD